MATNYYNREHFNEGYNVTLSDKYIFIYSPTRNSVSANYDNGMLLIHADLIDGYCFNTKDPKFSLPNLLFIINRLLIISTAKEVAKQEQVKVFHEIFRKNGQTTNEYFQGLDEADVSKADKTAI